MFLIKQNDLRLRLHSEGLSSCVAGQSETCDQLYSGALSSFYLTHLTTVFDSDQMSLKLGYNSREEVGTYSE